jgi:hypothetical protein
MSDFKKPVAKVEDAASKLFLARLEAIDEILAGANPHEVLLVCAHALAAVAPNCCEAHQAEFEADLLDHLRECVAQQQDADAEMDADGDAPPPHVH